MSVEILGTRKIKDQTFELVFVKMDTSSLYFRGEEYIYIDGEKVMKSTSDSWKEWVEFEREVIPVEMHTFTTLEEKMKKVEFVIDEYCRNSDDLSDYF